MTGTSGHSLVEVSFSYKIQGSFSQLQRTEQWEIKGFGVICRVSSLRTAANASRVN